ncbi:hypothetical protein STM14_1728 [Salmonella enterica subsp. enterica serovar Typhimurium str. 14028S]|uniref:Uncharacterized protein n=1 Tax=Salmonella typhimurium (strain 14028s / SGSC 2262) TaxID=588858 RepID=A0A0F6B122_SALT1|nr:hypothetical protein STM14_1728 [Salmonella enterica subsp. enterica serovar Typhimurium str. 14028S]
MRYITFCVGIKRRKLDEYRPEIFVDYYADCSGRDCRRWINGRSALISSLLRVGVSSILSLSKTQKAYLLRTQTYAARFFATNSQLTSAQKCSR